MKTVFVKPAEAERKWYVIDAEGKVLGRVAAKVASILRGKNKATFAPHQELGDYVVVINADKIVVTGRKPTQKMYYHHTGYVGGMKSTNFESLIARHPADPLELAIKGMLPKGPLGRKLFKNVKVYAGANHPHAAQNPQVIEL
ncbi:MAG TPA: 50S ribosomal protein L13 [Treponema sp.]|mgnify:FL=1|jgi:large subunit ribosomal protein L13|uniref:50S ribosomal protein L13 n=1 Tax=Gracilinema caldarium TaxID=215591 RepID=UPI0016B09048|nr:50S ribosomal protein L13 [Gracilinema caldarium]NLJ09717.1 50S ribosomal protein L13 [Treponema sp.]HON13805.1 50S ribosomal protein L13 [Treponema sp.]HPC71377.1 50S ribosomal protein L13 [Treponema sp.]HRS03709.1 50S ribosomal protein L13 [Treponema sp.]HRU28470.1 50S ribosomal protein L13 [Treponema sp.]